MLEKLNKQIIELEKVHGKIVKSFNPIDSVISFKYTDGTIYKVSITRNNTKAILDKE